MRDSRYKPSRKHLDSRLPGTIRVVNGSFLNSAPFGKLGNSTNFEYLEAPPSECARMLYEQEVDLALTPVAEILQQGDYDILPYGIITPSASQTVLLLSNSPLNELKTILIDEESRSSAMLLRVCLLKDMSNKVNLVTLATSEIPELMGPKVGALVIGDKSFELKKDYKFQYDLGSLWHEETSLPFVFALWACRKGTLNSSQIEEFRCLAEQGIENKIQLAKKWSQDNTCSPEVIEQYLNETINYRLSNSAISGLKEFAKRASKSKAISETSFSSLDFLPLENTSSTIHANSKNTDEILSRAISGDRVTISDALYLARHATLSELGCASNEIRNRLHPTNDVSYIVDRNINHTNVCNVYCRFCAFYRSPGSKEGYLLSKEKLGEKIQQTVDAGGIQILLQGGLHPDLNIEYYEDLFPWIKENYKVNLHALSSDEIWYIAKISNLSISKTLKRLIAAGLGSLPGAGAELLIDRVRHRIANLKTSSKEWLNVHRLAHAHGITSTCTMMFGVQETWLDRIIHLHKLRSLQDETGGFTAFITWPFQHENTSLKPGDTSSSEYLRVQALSRIFLDNIKNIQSSWVTQGPEIGQVALFYGANDFGSTMFEENVVSAAGTTFCMNADFIEETIRAAGFRPWRRDVHYKRVSYANKDNSL